MIIYGKQIVLYVLEKHSDLIEEIFLSKEIDNKLFSRFAKLNKKIHRVDNQKAQALAKGGNHQGMILKLSEFNYTPLKQIKDMNFIVVLDGLTDVGNIGAIARTAYSLGVQGLIASNIKTVNNSGTNSYTIYVTAYNGDKSISNTTQITVYKAPKLLWSDEFDKDCLPDSTKWGYDTGNNTGWGNNELEYYTNRQENANVSNGILKINLIKESYQGFNYTSARLLSKGKFSFKYGRVDIRAKLPSGGGTWPALWMLGDNITSAGWPACGEIDIMEHVGNQLNKIYATLHHPNHSGANGDGGTVNISNATSEFHIYSLDWSSNQIKFYVDNQLFYTFANNSNLPFNQNFFLIMNVAMGGNFGGTVDSNFTSSSMEIDYVRVYQ
jgi:beta-glucanase (GH16 family)